MSSSGVCQGLQSCLEPRLMEPRVLRPKLAPPKSNFSRSTAPTPSLDDLKNEKESHTEENNTTITATLNNQTIRDNCDVKSHKLVETGGWSFLQHVNNNVHNTKKATENDKVYVHPLVKRSSSTLSKKSLEMCTESLGSETGIQLSEGSDNISFISPETEICTTEEPSKQRENLTTKRRNRKVVSFPPPLTSISGSTGLQVRPHREGGRLVLQAVTFSSCHSYFHAERRDGRLRISLVKDFSPNMDNEDDQEEEKEEAEEYGEEEFDEEEEVEIKDEELVYDEENEAYWGEDIEGNGEKVRGQIGVEKLPRPSRCNFKEGGRGNKGLLNWEPFLVAT